MQTDNSAGARAAYNFPNWRITVVMSKYTFSQIRRPSSNSKTQTAVTSIFRPVGSGHPHFDEDQIVAVAEWAGLDVPVRKTQDHAV